MSQKVTLPANLLTKEGIEEITKIHLLLSPYREASNHSLQVTNLPNSKAMHLHSLLEEEVVIILRPLLRNRNKVQRSNSNSQINLPNNKATRLHSRLEEEVVIIILRPLLGNRNKAQRSNSNSQINLPNSKATRQHSQPSLEGVSANKPLP